jgi:NAD+ synthase (glutamine-hydrolysing)
MKNGPCIALAQLDLLVGDVQGNLARVRVAGLEARRRGADLVVFPELTLSGYPPEDLLFHRGLRIQVEEALAELAGELGSPDAQLPALLVGYPEYEDAGGQTVIYNSARLLVPGRPPVNYRKVCLPNYQVFDEKRYFMPGSTPAVVEFGGVKLGLVICEDLWEQGPARLAQAAGADLLISINASPYERRRQRVREAVLRERVMDTGLPIIYVNLVGGQDELVFDGHTFALDASGAVVLRAPAFEETLQLLRVERHAGRLQLTPEAPNPVAQELADEESIYRALVLGVRDYVQKHRFPGVVIGLSGGVDSALTLAIAVDALGAGHVQVVMMPSQYTSQMSKDDALAQATRMGVAYGVIPIEGMFEATLAALSGQFAGREPDTTEENIQARIRGLLLMAISNKSGRMLLTTGNKSEMAVGYATLYGDMNGGFAPIKDCSKMLVYRLARWRNAQAATRGEFDGEPIPSRVIEREPSAELRSGQKDSDSLPPYEVLDAILEAFIEEDLSVDEIVARGFDREVVGRVLDMVKRNEYKRRQAPPGVRVSRRAFGRDWRYPITSGYRR